MSSSSLTPAKALEVLDARHDELIRKLDDLNAQIEVALKEFAVRREAVDNATPSLPAHLQRKLRKAA